MENTNIKVTVYERIRRYGTKGKTRGEGHAKSVTKLVHELEVGDSIWAKPKAIQKEDNQGTDGSTIIVAEFEDVTAEQAVRFLDKFEKSNDGKAAGQKMAHYADKKQMLLDEYGAKSSADLTEAAKARFKKELAKSSFYYYEYQVVVTYGDNQKVHSHRMKLISKRPASSWALPKVEPGAKEDLGNSENND